MAAGELAASPAALSIDQLVALGEEIAALARAGVPLESGLAEIGREMPGGLRERFAGVADSLVRGESIDRALADPRIGFSPVAQGVIAAGMRSNRLAAAIEGLVNSARLRADLRRLTGLALIYPLALVLVAYGLLWLNLFHIAPEIVESYYEVGSPPPGWLVQLERLRAIPAWLCCIPPVALVAVVGWCWVQTGKVGVVEPGWSRKLL